MREQHLKGPALLAAIRAELRPRVRIPTPFGMRHLVYADWVASGQPLASLERQIAESITPYYANTHSGDSWTGAVTTQFTHEATAYLKRIFGADERYALLFVGSGATGAIHRWQEILGLIGDPDSTGRPPGPRPFVLVGPYEHHSNEVTWRETAAEVRAIPLGPDGTLDLEALEAAVSDPALGGRLKIGSFSAASNVTGVLTDTRAVARILHRHGALACFDFAAAGPYVPIDVHPGADDAYDAVYLSPHKFVGGPDTPGLLLFRRDLYRRRVPTIPGGGTVRFVNSTTQRYLDDIETREDGGTPPIVQKIRAALALSLKAEIGEDVVLEAEEDFTRRALERLMRHPRIQVAGPTDVARLGIVSLSIQTSSGQTLHPHFVVRLLNDLFGIQCRGGCLCAGPYDHTLMGIDAATSSRYLVAVEAGYEGIKPGWVRLAFHYAMTEPAFAFLLDALDFVADRGEAFLPQYRFDWISGTWSHPRDPAVPSLFEGERPSVDTGEPPYRTYLEEAKRLAERGPKTHEGVAAPVRVPADLIRFRLD